jgi:glucose-1-phosphatase
MEFFMNKVSNFKNIIFDLGGVLIDLNMNLTVEALASICKWNEEEKQELKLNAEVFIKYERGEMDDAGFRKAVREYLHVELHLEDEVIDAAWNKMLLNFTQERIALLQALRKKYKLYLLSNTNQIHLNKVNEILHLATGIHDLSSLFDKAYYSHLMKARKPEPEIFLQVLQENNLKAEETLFIDDNEENIQSAARLNIGTLHVVANHTLLDFFKHA